MTTKTTLEDLRNDFTRRLAKAHPGLTDQTPECFIRIYGFLKGKPAQPAQGDELELLAQTLLIAEAYDIERAMMFKLSNGAIDPRKPA